jgi:hypothetical protein
MIERMVFLKIYSRFPEGLLDQNSYLVAGV